MFLYWQVDTLTTCVSKLKLEEVGDVGLEVKDDSSDSDSTEKLGFFAGPRHS